MNSVDLTGMTIPTKEIGVMGTNALVVFSLVLSVADLNPSIAVAVEQAKEVLRAHVRSRCSHRPHRVPRYGLARFCCNCCRPNTMAKLVEVEVAVKAAT